METGRRPLTRVQLRYKLCRTDRIVRFVKSRLRRMRIAFKRMLARKTDRTLIRDYEGEWINLHCPLNCKAGRKAGINRLSSIENVYKSIVIAIL